MKRITLLAMGVLLCGLVATPAMALDLDFSGQYRTRGYYIDREFMGNTTAPDGTAAPSEFDRSYLDMRFRLQTVFKVNDNVSVTTRFDALDNTKWGDKLPGYADSYALQSGNADLYPNDQANVTFDRAYMTIKTPIGGFLAGRMKDNAWGTSFSDTVGDGDRLIYVVPVKNWIFAAVYEKWHEIDGDAANQGIAISNYASQYGSDQDNDKFYLSATYKSENFTTGLLYGYYRVNNFLDVGDEAHYQAINTTFSGAGNSALLRRPVKAKAHLLSPYIVGKWGDLEVQAEGTYAFGAADYTYQDGQLNPLLGTAAVLEPLIRNSMKNNGQSKDLKLSNFMVDATYNIGAFAINGGFAYVSGGVKYRNTDSSEATGFGIIEQGGDWHKLWILQGGNLQLDDNGMFQTLGGGYNPMGTSTESMGNVSNFQSQVSINGYKAYWLGLDYAVLDNMTLGALVGMSEADKVIDVPGVKWDKNHGTEYDLHFSWDIYENLNWRITYAYLKAGDYWKQGGAVTGELKDPYSLYTNVSVNF